jgi:hypothetical protein
MVPPFDIFRLTRTGPIWCANATDLEAAKVQAVKQAVSNPAAYIVVSLKTQNGIVIAPDGSTSTIGRLDN